MTWLDSAIIGAYLLCVLLMVVEIACRLIEKRRRHCSIASRLLCSTVRKKILRNSQLSLTIHCVFSIIKYSILVARNNDPSATDINQNDHIVIRLMAMVTLLTTNAWIACGILHMNQVMVKVYIKSFNIKLYRVFAYVVPLLSMTLHAIVVFCTDQGRCSQCDVFEDKPWVLSATNVIINLFVSAIAFKLTRNILTKRMERQSGQQVSKIKVFFSSGIMIPLFIVQAVLLSVRLTTNLLTKVTYEYFFNVTAVSLFFYWTLFNCIYNRHVVDVLSSALPKIFRARVVKCGRTNLPRNVNATPRARDAAARGLRSDRIYNIKDSINTTDTARKKHTEYKEKQHAVAKVSIENDQKDRVSFDGPNTIEVVVEIEHSNDGNVEQQLSNI